MGERLWRPLTNPKTLQTSAFVDKDPKGFGLCQRPRDFSTYEDLDARFDRRPTAWVEPKGGWGDGYVELIEIPVTEEIHDNIVAYWKPAKPLEPGKGHRFAYRLSWGADDSGRLDRGQGGQDADRGSSPSGDTDALRRRFRRARRRRSCASFRPPISASSARQHLPTSSCSVIRKLRACAYASSSETAELTSSSCVWV